MSKPHLYTNLRCPFAQRAHTVLEYSGVDYDRTEIDLENKPKEYLEKINPQGKVPTLVHNYHIITESGVIVQYVNDVYLEGTEKSLLPSDLYLRAFMRIWMSWWDDNGTSLLYTLLKNPSTRENQKIVTHDKLLAFQNGAFKHAGKYIIGDRPSLIDFHVNSFLERLEYVKSYFDFDWTSFDDLKLLTTYHRNWVNSDFYQRACFPKDVESYDRAEFLTNAMTKFYVKE